MKFIQLSALGAACTMMLLGCGSDSSAPAVTPPVVVAPSTQLTGSVAVGAPITDGKLRVLDATGAVVASDITVHADGSYTIPALTGTAPFRIEACGYAAANYVCIYSVAQGPGTSNVTPLTTATVLLASGQSPSDLMTGSNSTLSSNAVNGAQSQLHTSLASVLASGNVTSTFDFVGGALDAGSRSGYDKVLDAIGVTTGVDQNKPFVQITPRLGTGNLYLEQNLTVGAVVASAHADSLSLGGLETLFRHMSDAMASPSACSDATTGIATQLAANARFGDDNGNSISGAAQVGAGLCAMFAQEARFGSRLLSPTLGRCDLTGANPVCHVSFVLQGTDGSVEPVGQGMGVTQESGVWKFAGDLDAVQIHASAKAQRDARIDGDTPVYSYARAIAFDIPAASGLQCAQVTQHNASMETVTIAYYKRFGSGSVPRLSLWQQDAFSNTRSLDPLIGALRSADDTWVALPDGADGDVVVRNFFRGGRAVTVSMFSDANCSVPFAVAGQSQTSFEVEVEGVPPVWSAMPALPWPELTTAGRQNLLNLTMAANATGNYAASWTFPHGPLGLNGATVCTDRAQCGQGGAGRIGDQRVAPGSTSASVALTNGSTAFEANSYKMIALYGRTGDGLDLQSNAIACPTGTVECH